MYSRYYEEAAQEVIGSTLIGMLLSSMQKDSEEVMFFVFSNFGVDTFFDAPSHYLYPIWGIDGNFGVGRYPVSAWAILGHHGRQQSVRSGRRISEAKETGVFEKILIR